MRLRLGAAAVAALLTFAIAGAAAAVSRDPVGTMLALARSTAAAPAPALLRALDGTSALAQGSDGRLTIVALGSDTRHAGAGLTDTVMILSIKGNSISMASIPRDTARIPNPSGGTYTGRINSLLQKLAVGRGLHGGLVEFERVMEHLLQIEIDHYALLRFHGFQQLVEEIEPVKVRINKEIRDSVFWDDPDEPSGVYFPQATGYELYAWQPEAESGLCNGHWESQGASIPPQFWCHRAMPFVRSRKGPSNSDFSRAHRQQDFVAGAIKRVIDRGSGDALGSLVNRAQDQSHNLSLYTNVPLTMANALDMYRILDGAGVGFQEVFSPPQYATHIPGGSAYELDLQAVRKVMREHFGSTGSTPQPTPAPTPAPTASSTPRPTATPTSGSQPTPGPGATPRPTTSAAPTAPPPGSTPTPFNPATPAPTVPPGGPSTAPLPPGATPTPFVPGATSAPPGATLGPSGAPPASTLPPASALPPGGPTGAPAPDSSLAPPGPGASAAPPVPGSSPLPTGGGGGVVTPAPGDPALPPGSGAAPTPPAVAVAVPTPRGGASPGRPAESPPAGATSGTDYLPMLAVTFLLVGAAIAAGLIWRLRRNQ